MNKSNGAEVRKLAIGEVIEFEDVATSYVETRFGVTAIYNFADSSGKVFRKCFEQGGMAKFFEKHPTAKSIVLKKKLVDGDYTYNVWGLN
ncbi:hypothetical protein C5B42_04460 [Candidatus Cerribacteria bacterium 'Amazon FNV 2010 28 9']|uniref:Uncharacterized protein n=1 Tax=Candidatus Cerribacteria bacterium 'Amazon FNV 2010 28 9' TaxID=2081795 RepID=A0A317JQP6_9BACT|nr:MAG: hypothetical protein C5B42_04460 [Candidatus Cerribacteria bacterium 'Amazon FNV 2010 28 9']